MCSLWQRGWHPVWNSCFEFQNCHYKKCGLPQHPWPRTVVLSINQLSSHFCSSFMLIFNNNAIRTNVIAVFITSFLFTMGNFVVKVHELCSFRGFVTTRLCDLIILKITIWILMALRIFNMRRLCFIQRSQIFYKSKQHVLIGCHLKILRVCQCYFDCYLTFVSCRYSVFRLPHIFQLMPKEMCFVRSICNPEIIIL